MGMLSSAVRSILRILISGTWGSRLFLLASMVAAIVLLRGAAYLALANAGVLLLMLGLLVVIYRLVLGQGHR